MNSCNPIANVRRKPIAQRFEHWRRGKEHTDVLGGEHGLGLFKHVLKVAAPGHGPFGQFTSPARIEVYGEWVDGAHAHGAGAGAFADDVGGRLAR